MASPKRNRKGDQRNQPLTRDETDGWIQDVADVVPQLDKRSGWRRSGLSDDGSEASQRDVEPQLERAKVDAPVKRKPTPVGRRHERPEPTSRAKSTKTHYPYAPASTKRKKNIPHAIQSKADCGRPKPHRTAHSIVADKQKTAAHAGNLPVAPAAPIGPPAPAPSEKRPHREARLQPPQPKVAPIVPMPREQVAMGTQRVIVLDNDKLYPGESSFRGLICTASLSIRKHRIKVCRGAIDAFTGGASVKCTRDTPVANVAAPAEDDISDEEDAGDEKKLGDDLATGKKNRVRVGSAVVATNGSLGSKTVIHAAGPTYLDSEAMHRQNDDLLRSAYLVSLQHCAARKLQSVAFPILCASQARGTRPVEVIARTGWDVCCDFLKKYDGPRLTICFVASSEKESILLRAVLRQTRAAQPSLKKRLLPCCFK